MDWFTLMLLMANLANTKLMQKTLKMTETLAHVYSSPRVLSKSFPVNTNMTGFRWFSKFLHPCALDESIASALEGLK